MILYRNITIGELKEILETGFLSPKKFDGNTDSSIPAGNWSFWFNKPVDMHTGYIVEANFEPEMGGIMSFNQQVDYFSKHTSTKFQIEEFVTSEKVKVDKIWVENILDCDYPEFQNSCNDILTDTCWMNENDLGYFDEDEELGISKESMLKLKEMNIVEVFDTLSEKCIFQNIVNFSREAK